MIRQTLHFQKKKQKNTKNKKKENENPRINAKILIHVLYT